MKLNNVIPAGCQPSKQLLLQSDGSVLIIRGYYDERGQQHTQEKEIWKREKK